MQLCGTWIDQTTTHYNSHSTMLTIVLLQAWNGIPNIGIPWLVLVWMPGYGIGIPGSIDCNPLSIFVLVTKAACFMCSGMKTTRIYCWFILGQRSWCWTGGWVLYLSSWWVVQMNLSIITSSIISSLSLSRDIFSFPNSKNSLYTYQCVEIR